MIHVWCVCVIISVVSRFYITHYSQVFTCRYLLSVLFILTSFIIMQCTYDDNIIHTIYIFRTHIPNTLYSYTCVYYYAPYFPWRRRLLPPRCHHHQHNTAYYLVGTYHGLYNLQKHLMTYTPNKYGKEVSPLYLWCIHLICVSSSDERRRVYDVWMLRGNEKR